ncbi:hypothetical protein Tco_0064260 [Tanacetum coccineum]
MMNPMILLKSSRSKAIYLTMRHPCVKHSINSTTSLKLTRICVTFDIQGIGTYEEYELNNPVIRKSEEPGWDNMVQNYDTSNSSNTQDNQGHEERRDDPTHEPSVCKIKMMKYSFNADEEYIVIKESEYLNHSKDNLDAYRELLRIINEVWVVATLNE